MTIQFSKLPKNHRQWVKEEMVPFNPKPTILIAANHYSSAQAAWDAWTIPTELICALIKTNAPLGKLTLCVCDMASPAFAVLRSGQVDVRPFRKGIQLAKQLAETQAECLINPVLDIIGDLTANFKEMKVSLNIRYAAWAIIRAIRSAIGRRPALDVPLYVEKALLASLHTSIVEMPPCRRLLPRLENSRLSIEKIQQWQCKRIRKHFPQRPVWILEKTPAHQCLHLFGHLLPNVRLS